MFFFLYSRYPFLIADTKYNYMLCVCVYGLSSHPSTGINLFGGTNRGHICYIFLKEIHVYGATHLDHTILLEHLLRIFSAL